MFKHRALGVLAAAAALLSSPTLASAHDWHRGGWHGGGWHGHDHGHRDWHAHGFAPFVRVGIPVPVPVAYAPQPVYVAAPYPPRVYAPPANYPPYFPAPAYAPAPMISVRTPHVAVSIGGFFPFPF